MPQRYLNLGVLAWKCYSQGSRWVLLLFPFNLGLWTCLILLETFFFSSLSHESLARIALWHNNLSKEISGLAGLFSVSLSVNSFGCWNRILIKVFFHSRAHWFLHSTSPLTRWACSSGMGVIEYFLIPLSFIISPPTKALADLLSFWNMTFWYLPALSPHHCTGSSHFTQLDCAFGAIL